jgi:hypothetical protein
VKELAKLLGVSRSSVSLWVRDIELTEAQYFALRSTDGWADRWFEGECDPSARASSRGPGPRPKSGSAGQSAPHAGCMLFWAEGSRNRNRVEFVNSDPAMVKFFLRFLRECYEVPDEKVVVTCNLFADHVEGQRDIEQYWLDLLELPWGCLRKSTVNTYSKYSQKKRRNRLPYGTCRLAVHDTQLVHHVYGAIQEYAGFDREEWLM